MKSLIEKMQKKKIEFEIESFDDIKDKYFKIFIPNLKQAIEWLRKLGFSVVKDNIGYWLEVNKSKLTGKEEK